VPAVTEATPEEFKEAEPRVTPSAEKVTDPVGVVPDPVTVAFRVTDCPTKAGFGYRPQFPSRC
jgi:hypothetical protein